MDNIYKSGASLGLLRCDICGKVIECPVDELIQCIEKGWPKCCCEIMILYEKREKPITPLETPVLPS